MSKEEARAKNEFHVRVALYHLRAIVPDLVPAQCSKVYSNALKATEILDINLTQFPSAGEGSA